MRKLIPVLFLLIIAQDLSAQKPWIGVYNPMKERIRKKLIINSDSTFLYSDCSSGNCFEWVNSFGDWSVQRDTLLLYRKAANGTGYLKVLKFNIGFCRLNYSDTSDKNLSTNWGNFIFTGFETITEKSLPDEFRPNESNIYYDLYLDEYGWIKRKKLPRRGSFH